MDLKRNYSSNIQPPTQIKANHLLNPLIGIEKASTPVRTRIIKPGAQLNSTPVNVHKIGIPAKSPALLNKQNETCNSKLGLKKPKLAQHNLNLSPIMALNRKMSETPQLEYRSLTPTSLKRQESLSNILQKKDSVKNEHFGQNLQDSRTSNSFRNMLDSRSKTPTRIAFAEVCQKQNPLMGITGLRTSGSAQALLQGVNTNKLKDSRNTKLGESRSFEHLINLGTPVGREDEILCSNSNEHEKKARAKYKVMEEPEDEQILVYCSKCAINLVQKGFKVEDLTAEDIRRIKSYQQESATNAYQSSNEYYDYANETSRKLQIKLNELRQQKDSLMFAYQKELDDVECYYNSLLSLIEQQKSRDKQAILRNKQKEKATGDALQKKLVDASGELAYLLRSGRMGVDQLRMVQEIQSLLTDKGFSCRFDGSKCLVDKIEQRFSHFSQIFESEGRLRIESEQRDDRIGNHSQYFQHSNEPRQKADCPLRFSFEKSMKQVRKSPINFRSAMNPLEQANESMEGEDSNEMGNDHEKKAFRTLFPEDQEEYRDQNGEKQTGIYSPTFKQI